MVEAQMKIPHKHLAVLIALIIPTIGHGATTDVEPRLSTSYSVLLFVPNSTQGDIVALSGSVWVNKSGTLCPIAYPTNIMLNPMLDGAGGMSTVTNFLFQTSTRRIGGTNMLFGVFNGGASALVVGDQGIMIGSTNHILVPQMAIDIAYDTAFGVDTPGKTITMSSYHSTVGYSGNAELGVSTNFGHLNLTANKDGNGFIQFYSRVGRDANFIDFDQYLLIQNPGNTVITPYQIDPDFSMSPTGYIFGSTVRITNIHTLMSLQNSNTPMFEVDGIGDLKLLKRVPYSWPSAQGAAQTVLINDGTGKLAWGAVAAAPLKANLLLLLTNCILLLAICLVLCRAGRPAQGWARPAARSGFSGSQSYGCQKPNY
jgi:hypothetical protein